MRRAMITAVCLGLVGWWCGPATHAQGGKGPSKEAVAKAEKALQEEIGRRKAAGGQVLHITDPALVHLFPDDVFFALRFRIYPVARILPEGMKPSNVFVVRKNGQVEHLKDNKVLEQFIKSNVMGVPDEKEAFQVLAAWLTLAQEFHQDGMFKFQLSVKDFTATKTDKLTVTGRALVTEGGRGELGAKLEFTQGKLASTSESAKIVPGPRPICQATRLLDADPIVRRMAENDLLYMGLFAKDYLDEQRAKASPQLRQAIDRIWQRIVEQEK